MWHHKENPFIQFSTLATIGDLFKAMRMGGVEGRDLTLYYCMAKGISAKLNLGMITMVLPVAMQEIVKKNPKT